MPPEDYLPGSSADWLRHAYSDLELARANKLPNVLFEGLCFHAQQAVEKALKGLLIAKAIPFPKTHNIRTLLDILPKDVIAPAEVENAAILTDYAVTSRYPGDIESIEEEEYMKAVRLAEFVVGWVEGIIKE